MTDDVIELAHAHVRAAQLLVKFAPRIEAILIAGSIKFDTFELASVNLVGASMHEATVTPDATFTVLTRYEDEENDYLFPLDWLGADVPMDFIEAAVEAANAAAAVATDIAERALYEKLRRKFGTITASIEST